MAIQHGRTHSWRKSSYSGGNGACVEVCSPAPRTAAVRDSKAPAGPRLGFVPGSWNSFVTAVGDGTLARR
ncbi:DUF397 domain-containing protein [Streptomyces bohaiensis]|uniref:DUF397 domain-containing protein n=1 Tax=Streptomyces bohaiensis TaxID=1431344 RepID=A0ABX1CM97_9ACTN|nr:DUF397 domain-containing protein [Streptomyces bohaiensis]NJQ17779.1 DUF397 domain-containing protein [Streptomyces bohaiensis]